MAFIIHPDGSKTELKPANGKTLSLKEMQTAVGGYIESVPSHVFRGHVFCDEEGRIKSPPKLHNKRACEMCYPDLDLQPGYELLGDVLFCEPDEVE